MVVCVTNAFQVRLAGLVAVVERGGGCGFSDKVLAVQAAGALAVAVINTDAGTSPMMADDATSAQVGRTRTRRRTTLN